MCGFFLPSPGDDDRRGRRVCDRPPEQEEGQLGGPQLGRGAQAAAEHVAALAATADPAHHHQPRGEQRSGGSSGPAGPHQAHPTAQR